jgi:predicted acetyltransferase
MLMRKSAALPHKAARRGREATCGAASAIAVREAEGIMGIEVRPCASRDEFRQAITPITTYFGPASPDEQHVDRLSRVLPAERVYAAWDGDRVVGGLGSYPFQLTVPGGHVAAAGITVAGVLPTHRRRGVLRTMMRALIETCRQQGEPVAYLWATEDTIYGRFGFGVASFAGSIDIPRERSAFYAPSAASGYVRLVPAATAEEYVAPIYQRVAAATPGMFVRSPAWWQNRVLIEDWRRGGGGDMQCAVLEDEGRQTAYALYRMNSAYNRHLQSGAVAVIEAIGESPRATDAIWQYLFDIDLMARVTAGLLPLDHPLLLLTAEPRRLGFSLRDGVWVRLIDVGTALSARSYQAGASVVIEVADEFCPWNAGRWRIGCDGVDRTDEPPALRCNVTALGSVYLGGFTWTRLASALRVQELASGAAADADMIFQPRSAPWCPEIF